MSSGTITLDTDPRLDLIRTFIPEGKPSWTENIAWWLHDNTSGISLYAHLGRMQPDRSLWEGLSLIFLPDGGMLVNRSLGACLDQAKNGEYDYEPVVPNKIWQFNFDGVAQRVDPQQLRHRAVGDEPFEKVSYKLVFEAVQPVFNMHNSDINSEGMHLEHGGTVKGSFVIGGKRYEVDCTGYRDHSVSQRTMNTLDTETWANCVFPSGKVFSMLEVSREERQIRLGQVYRNGKMQLAKPVAFPDLTSSEGSPHNGEIQLEVDGGEIIRIQWQTKKQFVPFNLLRPVGMRPGIDHSMENALAAVQCPAIYTWDGETGYGWLERTRPVKVFK